MSYTQGEWKFHIDESKQKPDSTSFWCIYIVSDKEPKQAVACVYGKDNATLQANAHLIKAAPDMHEALKMAKECLCDLCRQLPNDERLADFNLDFADNSYESISKALAKAEGK